MGLSGFRTSFMTHILTLIAPPGQLDAGVARRTSAAMQALGADVAAPVWLAAEQALDIPFSLLSPGQADAAARREIGAAAIDAVAQPLADRKKKLLLADMDSTMITCETLDELADFAGLKEHIAKITAKAMNGEIDFKDAVRERVALLKGLSADMLEETFKRVVFTGGARELIAVMRANDAYALLVSGGFSFFTGRVAKELGFDADQSNHLEIENGALTGKVAEPILDRFAKLDALIQTAAKRQIPLSLSMAVGDGANDLDMIKAAGLGVALHAKPVVAAEARARIDHCDLKALLYIQGYHEEEIRDISASLT